MLSVKRCLPSGYLPKACKGTMPKKNPESPVVFRVIPLLLSPEEAAFFKNEDLMAEAFGSLASRLGARLEGNETSGVGPITAGILGPGELDDIKKTAKEVEAFQQGQEKPAPRATRKRTRNPHLDDAGHRYSTRSGPGGAWVTVYLPDEQGIDVGGDKYAVVCQAHATLTSDNWLEGAKLAARTPRDWCEKCRAVKST
jgi:hypothetical protein